MISNISYRCHRAGACGATAPLRGALEGRSALHVAAVGAALRVEDATVQRQRVARLQALAANELRLRGAVGAHEAVHLLKTTYIDIYLRTNISERTIYIYNYICIHHITCVLLSFLLSYSHQCHFERDLHGAGVARGADPAAVAPLVGDGHRVHLRAVQASERDKRHLNASKTN